MKYKEFKHWWTNYYWYHFKWATIGAVTGIVLVTFLIHDIVTRVEPDLHIAMITGIYLPSETMDKAKAGIERYVGDLNGDKKSSVLMEMLAVKAEAKDQYDMAMQQKYLLMLVDNEVQMFIIDEEVKKKMIAQEVLGKLSEFGLQGEDEYTIRIDQTPMLKGLFTADYKLYAALKTPENFRNKGDLKQIFNPGIKAIEAIIYAK